MYVVFQDLVKASNPKVHKKEGGHYQKWLRNPTKTTTWHGPYASEEEAMNVCRQIARETGMSPVRASCCM